MKKVTKIEATKAVKKQPLRVAAYIRVSTSLDDQLDSLEAQRTHYQQLFKHRLDWEVVGIYADEGQSGVSIKNRMGMQRLLDDCRQGKIDLILTKSISRFARNLTECLETVRELASLGVAIHFDRENLNTQQMNGELLLSMLSALAENESKSISENAKWSFKRRIENGLYKHISAPFGYEIQEGQLVVNEEKAQIIRMIFAWYLSGDGTHVIAKRLNEMGIAPERAKAWQEGSVMGMLKNERYVGDALFQKTFTDDQFKRHKNNYEVEMMYVSDSHQAIVDRETFDRVQALIEHRQSVVTGDDTDKYFNRYPLSQIIHCGRCGGNFIRRTHYSSNGRSYIAWTCSNQLRDPEQCGIKFIKEIHIQEAFMTLLNKLIFSRQTILEPTLYQLSQPSQAVQIDVEEIEQELQSVQDQLFTLSSLKGTELIDVAFYQSEELKLQQAKKDLLMKQRMALGKDEEKVSQLQAMKDLVRALDRDDYFQDYDESLLERILKGIRVKNRTCLEFELTCGLRLEEEVRV